MLLAFSMPDYASDSRSEKRTLMVRLGWAAALRLHDLTLALAVLAIVFGFVNGLPRRVTLGSLIILPLILAQMWQIERVRRGGAFRPGLITGAALGIFALAVYLQITGYMLS
jgi:1,4-dihydroxy-2-naphthoate octaprenyltransferase